MLDLLGSGYVIEHCVAAFLQRKKQEVFENYVSDSLYYIGQAVGVKLSKRLHEIRNPEPVDERSPKEIMEERIKKYGITVVK